MSSSEAVAVVEVGPRDGLQYEPDFFPTDQKIKLINLLMAAGFTRIEIGSFVHPKVIAQFKDVMEVVAGVKRPKGVFQSVLVPNLKGCERAITTPVDELALFVSASETHNQKNVNMTVAQSLDALAEVAEVGKKAGKRLRGYVVTALGCPYEGRVPIEGVLNILARYQEMGVSTGIDLEALLKAGKFAQEVIGSELPSRVLKAGRPNWGSLPTTGDDCG